VRLQLAKFRDLIPKQSFLLPALTSKVKEKKTMSDENGDVLCTDCGEAFSAFLQGMADHNAKVTACPKCGKNHEFKPPKAAEPVSQARTVSKPN